MANVLLRWKDGREEIMDIENSETATEIQIQWPARTFVATDEIKDGLDVWIEQ